MTVSIASYTASNNKGMLKTVDFSTVDGNALTFFELFNQADLEAFESMVTSAPLSQEILAITHVSGRPVVVTRGTTSSFFLLDSLKSQGEVLQPVAQKKELSAWKIRSMCGFGGQTLQIISSFLRPSRKVDSSIFVFATANLAANVINMLYHNGQQVEDVHQLHYLKQRVNRELSPHLAPGQLPIAVSDHRAKLHETEAPKPIEKAKSFFARHSVAIGELGLRYLGAVGLAFPARGWGKAYKEMRLPAFDASKFRVYTGLSSIFGKTVALGSAIPDPYNPKPPTLLDHLREKFTFITGGLIEITSFSALAYDCFRNSTEKNAARGIMLNGKHYRDWLGGIGASMFVLGYIARIWAPFGERHVDMKELYAHASDMLAETPPEKIPQLLANTAASLSEHFDGNGPHFAQIYSNLINDLSKFHGGAGKRVLQQAADQIASSSADKVSVKPPVMLVEKPENHVQAGQVELTKPTRSAHVASMEAVI